jgi:hypothetical protein
MYGNMIKQSIGVIALMITLLAVSSCDKVSPTGVLVGGSGTDDRVKMSVEYFKNHLQEDLGAVVDSDQYSFLVGSDSHIATDTCRMAEMLQNGLDHEDVFYASLGDIADTQAEYYIKLENTIQTFRAKFIDKYFKYDAAARAYRNREDTTELVDASDIVYPFFSAVGNHDITHNGWALFSSIFHKSFFDYYIQLGNEPVYDHLIFLDSANGTLGDYQTDLIDEGIFNSNKTIRHTFVFTHTNLFRPSSNQFSSTFPREELYYLLNKFVEWKATIVFCGHVHAWDEREVGGVKYLTLESMSERNSPDPGDYLVRVHCKKDGTVTYERVHMNYAPK